MKGSGLTRVYISIILTMIFWSLTFVWFKIVNEVYPPFTIIFLRLIISSLILLPIAWFANILQKINRSDYKWIILLSFFNPFLYFICESTGLTMISSTLAAVIVSTIPLFVPVGASVFFGEKLTPLNIIGILLSFLGVVIVVVNRDFSFGANPVGILLMLGAVFFAVGYTLLVKKLMNRYNAFSLTTYQNLLGIFLFLPLVTVFELKPLLHAVPTTKAIVSLICLAIFGSSLAFIFYNYSVKNLGASKANIFTNIIPVLTAVFSYFILDEKMTFQKITGIAVVLAGLLLSQMGRVNKKERFVSP
jgi:drug/metabolite transporter (DMT)-like permease